MEEGLGAISSLLREICLKKAEDDARQLRDENEDLKNKLAEVESFQIRGHTMGPKPGFFTLIHMAFPYIFFEE